MTSPLSDSLRRRIEKEAEALDSNPNKLYPTVGASSSENTSTTDDEVLDKVDKMPTPPPPTYRDESGVKNVPLWEQGGARGIEAYYPPSDTATPRRRGRNYDEDDEDMREGGSKWSQIVCESLTTFLFDIGLLACEHVTNIWLGVMLRQQEFYSNFIGILALFAVPSLFNGLLWFRLSGSYRHIGLFFMLGLVVLGMPSPIVVYIWQLYHRLFTDRTDPHKSRTLRDSHVLTSCFRVTQAFTGSVPLLLLNGYTLLSIMQVPGQDALDLSLLSEHLGEVQLHGLAALFSFLNLLRAASLFNERQTFSLLFVLVGYPFLLLTMLARVLASTIIVAFIEWPWIMLLGFLMVTTNFILYLVTRKTPLRSHSNHCPASTQLNGGGSGYEELHALQQTKDSSRSSTIVKEEKSCLCIPSEDSSSEESTSEAMVSPLYQQQRFKAVAPKLLFMSACSTIIPVGYTNDHRCHHPRIKGGVFVLLNFLFCFLWLGLALGFTIINNIPNTVHGVSLPQPSLQVEVPGSKVMVQAAGLDVALNLPNTHLDLGSMPTVSATLNTDNQDLTLAIALPLILAVITVPFVVMRAAMMELDCFIGRKKQLDGDFARGHPQAERGGARSLRRAVRDSREDRQVKGRLYVTLCCSIFGMMVFTVLLVLAMAFVTMQFH